MAEQDNKPGGRPGRRSPGPRTRRPQGARGEPGKSETTPVGAGGRDGQSRFAAEMTPSRPEKYLVAATPPAEASVIAAQLGQDPQITVARTIGHGQAAGGYPPVAVIGTTPERAAALAQMPALYVEPDQRLGWSGPTEQDAREMAGLTAGLVGELQRVVITVEDDGGHPVDGAAVCLSGPGLPALGFTGADGRAELTVAAETAAGPELLVVRPARDCWPTRVVRPQLSEGEPTSVRCERIVTTFPGFPDRPLSSWGSKVMGFDMLPPAHRGQGTRIAIIGSGAAADHPDLAGRLAGGRDLVGRDDKTWGEDQIGTGTHQAVLIAGKDDGTGVTGLAAEAELHICRTAPGGTCADLIEALDYCIEQKIDVALMANGITADSMLLAAKVNQARQHGIACIAAAGDGGREIARPAALPGVLAVGAVGQLGTFPPGSGLAAQLAGPPTPDGLFAPRFASHGPGLDCCAPGVAVVSGLPPASYGPVSGTGIAAAHVAAAAVLVLAHHPQFGPRASRDAGRVDQLFYLILAFCRPLPAIGPLRSGAGLPNVPAAVGVAPWGNHYLPPDGAPHLAAPPPASRAPEDTLQAALAPLDAAMQSAGLIPG